MTPYSRSTRTGAHRGHLCLNVDRVQQVVNTAYKYGRKVVVEGRSMVTIMDIASKLGYINVPEGTLIDIGNT